MKIHKLINENIEVKIYYSLDDNNNILIDEDSIREEFENKLKEILNEVEKSNK